MLILRLQSSTFSSFRNSRRKQRQTVEGRGTGKGKREGGRDKVVTRAELHYVHDNVNEIAAIGVSVAAAATVWLNVQKKKELSISDSHGLTGEENEDTPGDEEEKKNMDCNSLNGESGHELPLVKKSLQKSYLNIGMGQHTHLDNEEHLSGLQGSVASEQSDCPKSNAQDWEDSTDVADKIQGAGTRVNEKRRHLEEATQEIGTGKLFVTNNEVQELGFEGSVMNETRTCSEVHTETPHQMITNELQKSSTASSSISLATKEPHLLGNLYSAREGQSTGHGFGVKILKPLGSDIHGNGHTNLIVSEHLGASLSSNENSDAPETDFYDGASADHLSEKVESDSQHRLHLEGHEGSLSIPNIVQEFVIPHSTEEETAVSFAKKETCNSRDVGNGPSISVACLVAGAKKKRTWYKSHGRSTDVDIKLKDLLPIDSTKDASEYMRYYNCWLRAGRFQECLELLESMNRVGALDMNKVYHAKFFEICKEKRAVQEAFRFVKLIENPMLSTFNMLLSVCASAQNVEGAFQVLPMVNKVGLKPDCKLYTTLISSCAKGGKVDIMFKVFHEMVNAGIEPSIYTYGALIDGCARAGQVGKAFGVYGIMRSKKMKPDRVIFNALITACGRAGAVDRAFDILSEMMAEPHPLDPNHVTVGALINACSQSGQVDRALEVYKMVQKYGIKGTADVYTMAVSVCSHNRDLEFSLSVYDDMRKNGVCPDEVFFSALIDAAGHAGDIDFAFKILHDAKDQGIIPGSVMYSSLMGACSNTKNWQKALELYEEIKRGRFVPTVSTFNALITSLCDAGKLHKSIEILEEMKQARVLPNDITYTILLKASHKEDEPELAFELFSRATTDGVVPNLTMCDCVTSLCLQRFQKETAVGQSIISYDSGGAQIHNQWTSWALLVYRQTISAGVKPTMEALSHVLGCLQMPFNAAEKISRNENLGFHPGSIKRSNLCSLIDGFGIYDPRAFSLYEEAASLGVVAGFPYNDSPAGVDVRDMQVYVAEVYLLTILKGLKHRLAAGAQLPNITVRLPVEKVAVNSNNGQKLVSVTGRTGQAVTALLRRMNLLYQGKEAYGKIRIGGKAIKHWLRPPTSAHTRFPISNLAKGIGDQQRTIRIEDLSIHERTGSCFPHNSGVERTLKFRRPWDEK